MDFEDSVLCELNESFFFGRDGVLRYQGRLCVPNVDGLRNQVLEEVHGSRYFIHPGSTKMYHDLRKVFWWDGLKKSMLLSVQMPTSESRTSKVGWITKKDPNSYLEVRRHQYGLCSGFKSDSKVI